MAKMKKQAASPTLERELHFWRRGFEWIFGVDEAGRGCLAGPVSAAVLAWKKDSLLASLPEGVRDSKQMTEAEREEKFALVQAASGAYGVGFAVRTEIDRWNILEATALGVARALEAALAGLEAKGVKPNPRQVGFLSDGNLSLIGRARRFCTHPDYRVELARAGALLSQPGFAEECIVGGDGISLSIAAASVLAKVSRDRQMVELESRYPGYEFALHKGYFTPRHKELLKLHGPCDEHRRSFAPVRELLAQPSLGLA